MITGLAYAGAKNGKVKWDGVRNFKFRKVFLGGFFQDMLEGFNINTSQWASRYFIFKTFFFKCKKYIISTENRQKLCIKRKQYYVLG